MKNNFSFSTRPGGSYFHPTSY